MSEITRQELKQELRENFLKEEAITKLLINHGDPNANIYPFSEDITKEELAEIFLSQNTK